MAELSPSAQTVGGPVKWGMMLLVWSIIAAPIVLIHPSNLNQDTYQYLAVANDYFQGGHWQVRDVHTVGPVLPAMLALAKWFLPQAIRFDADSDVIVAKAAAFGCYVAMSVAALAYGTTRKTSGRASVVGLALVLFSLPFEKDVYSFNGELVCGALIAWFIVVASDPRPMRLRHVLLTILALLVIYAKIQAVLLLGLCYWTVVAPTERKRALIWLAACLLVTELVLLFAGGGWLAKLRALTEYVGHGQAVAPAAHPGIVAAYTAIAPRVSHLWWTLSNVWWYFPITALVFVRLFSATIGSKERRAFMWWAIATIVTVYLPGRPYFHYLLFCIPLLFLYLPVALGELRLELQRPIAVWALLTTLASVKICALIPGSDTFVGPRVAAVFPAQAISPEAAAVKESLPLHPDESMFVHGWDFRFYSYFGTGTMGPEIAFVEQGTMSKQVYLRRLLQLHPTYIFDVVNHSGLVRDANLAIAAVPEWSSAIQIAYDKIYEKNGLVLYHARSSLKSEQSSTSPD